MSDVAIRIEHIWKKYRLGTTNYYSLKEDWLHWWRGLANKDQALPTLMWALQDISIDIKQGETVGIIGKNGSGKSTLLKILSRITTPTRGNVFIKGRMSSLLEVGTGFHPELTGKENILLNGAILGMTKREIKAQLDEIIAFSGIEAYLDTPVKRYSSGMYVRLAFAVAAHLRNDIIVVDEVLAVGDLEFQKKCLGKLNHLAHEGKTALIVSHQLGLIENMCQKAVVLQQGKLAMVTPNVQSAIRYYQQNTLAYLTETSLADRQDRQRHAQFLLHKIELFDEAGESIPFATTGKPLRIRLHYEAGQAFSQVSVALKFKEMNGNAKTVLWTKLLNKTYQTTSPAGYFDCVLPKVALSAQTYLLNILVETPFEKLDWIQDAYQLQVAEGKYYPESSIQNYQESIVFTDFTWE
jgi:lipopolysaccharide transport system ATP-binding protein